MNKIAVICYDFTSDEDFCKKAYDFMDEVFRNNSYEYILRLYFYNDKNLYCYCLTKVGIENGYHSYFSPSESYSCGFPLEGEVNFMRKDLINQLKRIENKELHINQTKTEYESYIKNLVDENTETLYPLKLLI